MSHKNLHHIVMKRQIKYINPETYTFKERQNIL